MFAELCAHVIDCHELGKIVYLGGDFNSRPGDFNCVTDKSFWNYSENVDKNCNSHGMSFFKDLCSTVNVMPLNHMKFNDEYMQGDFTYHKGDLKSQIDYVLRDRDGLDFVDSFSVIQNNWHLSDHKPVEVILSIYMDISAEIIYRRSRELNFDVANRIPIVTRFKGDYDYPKINDYITSQRDDIIDILEDDMNNNDVENALCNLDDILQKAHKAPGMRLKSRKACNKINSMKRVNDSFKKYKDTLSNPVSSGRDREQALNDYLDARKDVHKEVLERVHCMEECNFQQ